MESYHSDFSETYRVIFQGNYRCFRITSKIAAGAVTAEKISVSELSAISANIGTFESAATGERVVIETDRIRVYDANNILRVIIGDLT